MKPARRHGAVLAAVLACCPSAVALAQSPPRALVPIRLHASFMRSSFSGVNETDAKAAFKVFAARMGEKRGYAITPEVHIFDDVVGLQAHLKREPLDLVVIDTWDYLALAPIDNLPVAFAAIEQGAIQEEFLVLVRKDSGLNGLTDLAGKHVTVLRSSNANTVRHWFQTEITALGHGAPGSFLGRLEIKEHLSQAVLPVFFGKADACALDRRGFETIVELNPQIGRTLRVLVRSEPYLDTLLCVRLDGWERGGMRQDLLDAMLDLPDDPAGRQIMTLFRFNGMVPFEERYLSSMRALRKRHDQLLAGGRTPQATPGGTP
jgi:phosphonate transport system substrate-binding protein